MRISIFGLGYVGAVCAGCLSARGHDVVGVDVAKDKIDMINAGKSPIADCRTRPGRTAAAGYPDRSSSRHDQLRRGDS